MYTLLFLASLAFTADAAPAATPARAASTSTKTVVIKKPAECETPEPNLFRPNAVTLCTGNIRGTVSADAAVELLEANADLEIEKARLARETFEANQRLVVLQVEAKQRMESAEAEAKAQLVMADAALLAVEKDRTIDAQVGDSRMRSGEAAIEANVQITGYDGVCRPSDPDKFVFDADCDPLRQAMQYGQMGYGNYTQLSPEAGMLYNSMR